MAYRPIHLLFQSYHQPPTRENLDRHDLKKKKTCMDYFFFFGMYTKVFLQLKKYHVEKKWSFSIIDSLYTEQRRGNGVPCPPLKKKRGQKPISSMSLLY